MSRIIRQAMPFGLVAKASPPPQKKIFVFPLNPTPPPPHKPENENDAELWIQNIVPCVTGNLNWLFFLYHIFQIKTEIGLRLMKNLLRIPKKI